MGNQRSRTSALVRPGRVANGRCVHDHDGPPGRVLREGLVEEGGLLGHPAAERVEDHDAHALVVDVEPRLPLLGEPVVRPVEVRAEGLGLVRVAPGHQHALLVVADRDHPVPGPRRSTHRREEVGPLGSLVRPVDDIARLEDQLRIGGVGQGPAQGGARHAAIVDLRVPEPDHGQRGGGRVGGREGAPGAGAAGCHDPVLVGGARREPGQGRRVARLGGAGVLHGGGRGTGGAHLLRGRPGDAVLDPLALGAHAHRPGDALRGRRIRGRGQQDPRRTRGALGRGHPCEHGQAGRPGTGAGGSHRGDGRGAGGHGGACRHGGDSRHRDGCGPRDGRWHCCTHQRGDGRRHHEQAEHPGTNREAFHASTVPTLDPCGAQGEAKAGASRRRCRHPDDQPGHARPRGVDRARFARSRRRRDPHGR